MRFPPSFDCFRHAVSAATLALTQRLVGRDRNAETAVLGTLAAPGDPGRCRGDRGGRPGCASAAVDGLCGAGVAALIMLEGVEHPDPGSFRAFDAAFNLAAYYQIPVLYLARHAQPPCVLDAARAAGARWAVGPGDVDREVASVPLELFDGGGASGLPACVRLHVSSWEVPAGTPVEAVAALRRALCC